MLPKIFEEDVLFRGRVTHTILPEQLQSSFAPGDTTPTVQNSCPWVAQNIAPVNVTNFDNGQPGQTIKVLGDGFTTVVDGTNIFTNTGANKLLVANRVYTFTYFQIGSTLKWVENA